MKLSKSNVFGFRLLRNSAAFAVFSICCTFTARADYATEIINVTSTMEMAAEAASAAPDTGGVSTDATGGCCSNMHLMERPKARLRDHSGGNIAGIS